MPDIDDFLPESAERQRKARQEFSGRLNKTNFGDYPDVQDICDAFLEEMGWEASRFTIKQVAAGARDFVDVHGQNIALMIKTIRYVRKHNQKLYKNIASPRSVITPARSQADPDRRRYLKGVERDED